MSIKLFPNHSQPKRVHDSATILTPEYFRKFQSNNNKPATEKNRRKKFCPIALLPETFQVGSYGIQQWPDRASYIRRSK